MKILTSNKIKTNITDAATENASLVQFQMIIPNDINFEADNDEYAIKCQKPEKTNIYDDLCCFKISLGDGNIISYIREKNEIKINDECFNEEHVSDAQKKLCKLLNIQHKHQQYVETIQNDINNAMELIEKYNNKDDIIEHKNDEINENANILRELKKKIKKKKKIMEKKQDIEFSIKNVKELINENNKKCVKKKKLSYDIDTVNQKIKDAQEKLKNDPENENLINLINKNNFLVRDHDQYMQNNKHIFDAHNKNEELCSKLHDMENENKNIMEQINVFIDIETQISTADAHIISLNEDCDTLNNLDIDVLTSNLSKLTLVLKKIKKQTFMNEVLDDVIFKILATKKNKNITINFNYL